MNTYRKLQVFVLVLILVSVTSCTPAPAALLPAIPTATNPPTPVPATATPVPTVTPIPFAMTATVNEGKCTLDGPMQIPAGITGFKLINKDPANMARLIVSTVDADKTLADLNAWPVPDQPPWLHIISYDDAYPGKENVVTATVVKGPIFLVCFNSGKTMPDIFGPIEVKLTASLQSTQASAQEAWDLLVISDSSNWGVGAYYAKLIEQDMHVKVNLHDCWVGNLAMGTVLTNLKGNMWTDSFLGDVSCKKPWPELVKEAEVMVLFGNPLYSRPSNGAWDGSVKPDACVEEVFIGKSDEPGDLATYKEQMLQSCAPETYNTYRADLGATLDEIEKIREGKPLILRMTDFYIPVHSSWKSENMDDVCTTCIENFSQAIHQVAEQHGVVVVSTMDGLNGKGHQLDPREKGYIGFDGIHLSGAGAEFVAKLLQLSGYAYSTKIQ